MVTQIEILLHATVQSSRRCFSRRLRKQWSTTIRIIAPTDSRIDRGFIFLITVVIIIYKFSVQDASVRTVKN